MNTFITKEQFQEILDRQEKKTAKLSIYITDYNEDQVMLIETCTATIVYDPETETPEEELERQIREYILQRDVTRDEDDQEHMTWRAGAYWNEYSAKDFTYKVEANWQN